MSVYMRPWTLNPEDATLETPLLTQLGIASEEEAGAHTSMAQGSEGTESPPKRSKKAASAEAPHVRRSYAATWQAYIDGNVVSALSRRFITNLLSATAARVVEGVDDSEKDSDESDGGLVPSSLGSLALVQRTLAGISARSADDGAVGMGKHAATIRLGKDLWQTPPLAKFEQASMVEPFFNDGSFPPAADALKAAAEAVKNAEERPQPYGGRTEPLTQHGVREYARMMDEWMEKLDKEKLRPNAEQRGVLDRVRQRILVEAEIRRHGRVSERTPGAEIDEEPLRGLVHGFPGTGKSAVIKWIRRLFTEALQCTHGEDFLCVAFQNRVAHAMGGSTLHAAGDVTFDGDRKLSHTDVDVLYTRNQHLRWIIIDEGFMIPDELLGTFAKHFEEAARHDTPFYRRADKSLRPFGGYNILIFGDMWQLPPIPASSALFLPVTEKKSEKAKEALNLFWGDDENALNYFAELHAQVRCDDPWYSSFLTECRYGSLSEENYNFLHGLPTQHAGSWRCDEHGEESWLCNKDACRLLPGQWASMAARGESWADMQSMECSVCQEERERRNRVMSQSDPRVCQEPFLSAPYVHRNNEPKFHAMLLRSVEFAKRGPDGPKHILWVQAHDKIENVREISSNPQTLKKKMERFLQFHDQKTSGIPGLLPLYVNACMRLTEKIAKGRSLTILKHTPCRVIGWDLPSGEQKRTEGSERLLQARPRCLYLQFDEVTWRIHPELPVGVFPLKPVTRQWVVNNEHGTKVSRTGFTLVPDFACTGFMIQGSTLDALLAECGDVLSQSGLTEMLTTSVILSRIRRAQNLLLL